MMGLFHPEKCKFIQATNFLYALSLISQASRSDSQGQKAAEFTAALTGEFQAPFFCRFPFRLLLFFNFLCFSPIILLYHRRNSGDNAGAFQFSATNQKLPPPLCLILGGINSPFHITGHDRYLQNSCFTSYVDCAHRAHITAAIMPLLVLDYILRTDQTVTTFVLQTNQLQKITY